MKKLLVIAFFTALTLSSISSAATVTGDNISLELIPENPKPYETVTAQIRSFAVDINELPITWRYNGTIIANGIGQKLVTVQAGRMGSRQLLEVTIRVDSATTIKKELSISPSSAEVLWEAIDTYTPPFYKGKPLPAIEGLVRTTVFPENGRNPRALSYTWSQNGSVNERVSGYGKISFIFRGSYLNLTDDISATIKQRSAVLGTGRTLITYEKPFVLFYKKVNGFINYARLISGNHTMADSIETYVAEPFYFSVPYSIERDLSIAWLLGGETATQGDRVNELVVSRGDARGSTTVTAPTRNPKRLLQFSEDSFRLNF